LFPVIAAAVADRCRCVTSLISLLLFVFFLLSCFFFDFFVRLLWLPLISSPFWLCVFSFLHSEVHLYALRLELPDVVQAELLHGYVLSGLFLVTTLPGCSVSPLVPLPHLPNSPTSLLLFARTPRSIAFTYLRFSLSLSQCSLAEIEYRLSAGTDEELQLASLVGAVQKARDNMPMDVTEDQ
jgi:Replication factor C C-terminal domain